MIYFELLFAQNKSFKWVQKKRLKQVHVHTLKNKDSTAKKEKVPNEFSFQSKKKQYNDTLLKEQNRTNGKL